MILHAKIVYFNYFSQLTDDMCKSKYATKLPCLHNQRTVASQHCIVMVDIPSGLPSLSRRSLDLCWPGPLVLLWTRAPLSSDPPDETGFSLDVSVQWYRPDELTRRIPSTCITYSKSSIFIIFVQQHNMHKKLIRRWDSERELFTTTS